MCKWVTLEWGKVQAWSATEALTQFLSTNQSPPPPHSEPETEAKMVSLTASQPGVEPVNMEPQLVSGGLQPLSYEVVEPEAGPVHSPLATCQAPGSLEVPNTSSSNRFFSPFSPRQLKHQYGSSTHAAVANPQWPAVLVVGLGTGLTAYGVNMAAENLAGLRLLALLGPTAESMFAISFLPVEHLNLALFVVAAALCAAIAVAAGNTGLTDMNKTSWAADLLQSSPTFAALVQTMWRSCQLTCQALIARHLALSAIQVVSTSAKESSTEGPAPLPSASAPPIFDRLCDDNASGSDCLQDDPPFSRQPGSGSDSSECGTSGQSDRHSTALVTGRDLAELMWRLESAGGDHEDPSWELIVEKDSSSVHYVARRRDPENGGATEYLSTTRFHNCSPEVLRDFYMDSDYLLQWEPMLRSYRHLGVCCETGVESGQFVKKYPLCSAREYVLAWKVWQKESGVYYCVTKAVESPQVPREQKFRRVDAYKSMWRIRSVPGTNTAEVLVYLQEDSGMQREFAKMAFRRGIWSYIRKTDESLRRYTNCRKVEARGPTAVSLASEVPQDLVSYRTGGKSGMGRRRGSSSSLASLLGMSSRPGSSNQLSRHPSAESLSDLHAGRNSEGHGHRANASRKDRDQDRRTKFRKLRAFVSSLVMVGGALALTHGGAPLGVKVVAACLIPSMIKPQRHVIQ